MSRNWLLPGLLLIPVVEIVLLVLVGQAIGGGPTVLLLLAAALAGVWLMRKEGRRAWAALQGAVQSGRMPDRELGDSAMVMAGGALLAIPGFLSDIAGILLILPVTRPFARRGLTWFFGRRVSAMAARSPYGPLFDRMDGAGAPGGPGGAGRVVHGEVIHEDEVVEGQVVPRRRDPRQTP
ncbi:FxsA family protein [Microtetraspora niveoalba]|uniref:FxsA family protein n=1 Tax=Microtetraspora niveoalba TaxID=46175 RepID=UPI00083540BB|nr:FxsA family protein [Microtetraspora niveoalba]